MHKVAVSSSAAVSVVKLAALCLSEISDRRKLTLDQSPGVIAAVQGLQSSICIAFIAEFCIDVANQMLSKVGANQKIVELPEL